VLFRIEQYIFSSCS